MNNRRNYLQEMPNILGSAPSDNLAVHTVAFEPEILALLPSLLMVKGSFTPIAMAVRAKFSLNCADKPDVLLAILISASLANAGALKAHAVNKISSDVCFIINPFSMIYSD